MLRSHWRVPATAILTIGAAENRQKDSYHGVKAAMAQLLHALPLGGSVLAAAPGAHDTCGDA